MSKIIFCTPKALVKHKEQFAKLQAEGWTIKATVDVYMNMMGGWTADECDDVAYAIENWQPKPLFIKN